jgi:pimeloyl-ACP methyl ester carboxylesterase
MKRLPIACVLALSTLWFAAPAHAELPPPLPKAVDSFDLRSLHVDVYGTAGKPALVLIPGLACGPWEWSGEIARLSPQYTIYALTLPGFDGRAPISSPLFSTVSEDFWAMLDSHHIIRPAIAGHSLGGTLAIVLAEQHSDRLRGVIAVDGLPVFPGFDKMTPEQRQEAAGRFSSMLSASTPQQFESAERSYVLPNYLSSKSDVDAVAPLVAKSDPKIAGEWMAEDVTSDARAALKSISIPLLEIAPYDATLEASLFTTAAAKQAYYQSLLAGDSQASVVMIPQSRHFVMYDQPDRLGVVITGFLQGLP